MALTPFELQSIIQLIRQDPEVRRQFQDALQLDGLLELPTHMDRVEAALEKLAESQQRSEHRLDRLEQAVAQLIEAQRRSEERLDRLEQAVAQLIEAQQRSEERLDRLEQAVVQLIEAQRRSEERLDRLEQAVVQLIEAQGRSEERLDRLEETVTRLAEAQLRSEVVLQEVKQGVESLAGWRRGEEGRRNGEQYERTIEWRTPSLLGGGMGGGPQRDVVYSRVQALLAPLYQEDDLASEADPMLADIIWWKADRYVVAEVSIRVDRLDVLRASQRAESLRRVGVAATGVVIGDEWVADDTLALAEEEAVEWKVGSAYSPGLIEYRRIVA